MTDNSQQPEAQDGTLSSLNMAIDGLILAKEVASVTPAKAVFGSVAVLLTMIRDMMVNEQDYIELGLSCADICGALERGMGEKELNDLNKSVCDAINQLTTTVADIQKKIIKKGGRHRVSRFFHSRNDKDTIAAWRSDLNRLLHVFNTELAINTHTIVADMRQDMLRMREDANRQNLMTSDSVPGELPPPPPRLFFGRDELIERIVGLSEHLTPIALIGAGGIGKTSTVLTVLHDDRIKQRFGDNRWFIRCDEFPASRTNFLRTLSKVIGAGVENPEDLASLRRYLSSKKMLIVLDNAESVLDLQESSGQEIYVVVDELTRFNNIFLCITSRISTIPPDCEILNIPTLSTEAARNTFYRIYKHGEQSDPINNILEQLDFHPLSISLLATVAQHNQWETGRLVKEWERQRTGVLHIQPSRSLSTTIELSLTSPMFRELGPGARELLGVIAFFPQGINEERVDWLLPTISDGSKMFNKFCILSLTYRRNGFVTMLAPLRDYLRPNDPMSSPLLVTTKASYFTRLSVKIRLGEPSFEESRWIVSEDVNVEHLLDIFTSIDMKSQDVWRACARFMDHLYRHKPRLVMLGPKMEALPDDHPSKPECLRELAWLLDSVGNLAERKRLLTHALKLWRERGDDLWAAQTLSDLADANRQMDLLEEGIGQAKEASEIFEQIGDTARRAESLTDLAWLLHEDGQLDAAVETASLAINLLPEKGQQHRVCQSHRALGEIYSSKDDTEKAVHHFEVALGVASSLNMAIEMYWDHHALVNLFLKEGKFDDAQPHIERAKLHVANNPYLLARMSWVQAWCWGEQHMFEEARSEALQALSLFEKLGAANDAEKIEWFLERIDRENVLETGDEESVH